MSESQYAICSPIRYTLTSMLTLGQDILSHNVIPLLNLKDILSLRLASKDMQSAVENCDWDSRYYEDFPFDARRLEGHGITRYRRRCRARIVFDGLLKRNSLMNYVSFSQDPALVEVISREPVVDMLFFDCHLGGAGLCQGVLVRRLDNGLVAYTALGVQAVLDTAGASRLHGGFRHPQDVMSDDVILGRKDGKIVEYPLWQLGMNARIFAQLTNGNPSEAPEEWKSITPQPRPQLSGSGLDLFTELDTWPEGHVQRRLREPPSSLNYYYYYTKAQPYNDAWEDRQSERYGGLVATLLKEIPILDMVVPSAIQGHGSHALQPYAVAASAGCSIFIVAHASPRGRVYKNYSFTLPHKIVTLVANQDLCALDEKGNVYVGKLRLSRSGELVVSEPKPVLQNVVQLAGPDAEYDRVRALMSDGTVKHVSLVNDVQGFGRAEEEPSCDIGVGNAVLIEGVLNLVVD